MKFPIDIDPATKERIYKFYNRLKLYLNPKVILSKLLYIFAIYKLARKLGPLKLAFLAPVIKSLYDVYRAQTDLSLFAQSKALAVAQTLPIVKDKLQAVLEQKLAPEIQKMELDELKHREKGLKVLTLPEKGVPESEILKELDAVDAHIQNPYGISGGIYAPYSLREFKKKVHSRVITRNPMHDDLWKSLPFLEAQMVKICLNLYHAPETAWGKTTGGGTMSIYDACKAYYFQAQNFLWPVTAPEIIASDRVHPAFDKACKLLGIKLIKVPVDPDTLAVDLKAMESEITYNTIALVASAPPFSEAIIEDIEDIATLADKYDIGCHVDACLGGFCLPFAERAGIKLPKFDFRVKGVTSISKDSHKYGMSEKNESIIMYATYELAKYSTHVHLDSAIGLYATLGIEGSRQPRIDGWATALKTGFEGYVNNLKQMCEMKDTIVNAIHSMEGVQVCGKPLLPIFAIKASADSDINILLVASKMKEKGWVGNGLPDPARLHFCITPTHLEKEGFADDYIKDLSEAIEYAKAHPKEGPKGTLGMYDLLNSKVPKGVKGPVLEILGWAYLRILGQAEPYYSTQVLEAPRKDADANEEDMPRPPHVPFKFS